MRIPKPSRSWFQFSVRTMLLLTLLVALGIVGWRAHRVHLNQQLVQAEDARNAALKTWRQIHAGYQTGDLSADAEGIARQQYFEQQAAVEQALSRVLWPRESPGK